MHVIETLGTGGAERLLTVLLPSLRQRGVHVSVVVMRNPLDLKVTLEEAGIAVFQLPLRRKWNLFGYALDLSRLARQEGVDILHAHLYFPAVCTALASLMRLSRAATVVTFHNLAYATGVNKPGPGLQIKRILASLLYPAGFNCKIAVSQAVASHYHSALGLSGIEVVHNPVDIGAIDQLGLQKGSWQGGMVHVVVPGRLVHEKGHSDFLKALVLLTDKGHNLRITFAGGGPLQKTLESEIHSLQLQHIVSITGVLQHESLLTLIASADLVVIPSRFEGLPLTPLEAMALSRPVVVTAVGGLVEIVENGVSGLIVPARDPASLATAIESLIADEALRESLGFAARRRVEYAFALPLITEQIHALYQVTQMAKPVEKADPDKQGVINNPTQAGVLYISYTGLLDPLGQSQVLQYVIGLARGHRMTLLTFEKPEALHETSRVLALAEVCRQAGVDWHYLIYHNRPNLPATFLDLIMGIKKGIQLVRQADTQIVHCRSYLAGLMGLAIKRATGVRHLFDMRGFWPDERVDGGIWRAGSFQYRLFKRLERTLFLGTDHVVSLTRSGVKELGRFDYLADRLPPVTVIPTCTNLEIFRPKPLPADSTDGFTLGYVGSTGSWYLFDHVARVVKSLLEAYPQARFLVINKGAHQSIRQVLLSAGVPMARVEIKGVPFENVADEIARMNAGIFLIKPLWSKRASCPTRMGEFLGMGKPCLANGMVGDVEAIFAESGTGVVINDFDPATLERALHQLVAMSKENGITARCRRVAEEHFSLQGGINSYAAIYASLASNAVKRAA